MAMDDYPGPELTVDEIMRRWPATIGVLIRRKLLCVGCPVGGFHTVADACQAHGIDEACLTEELREAIDGENAAGSP